MKNKIPLILIILFTITSIYAQKETAIWYFGNEAGIDFNSGSPVALTNGKLKTSEGCATISDKNGNLLFYTDGSTVWNKNHKIMAHGTGLLGHKSSTQSAIIVHKPGSPSIYYIFTTDKPNPSNADDDILNDKDDGVNNGLNYSEINMELDNGLGDIDPLKKNIHLITYNTSNAYESRIKCSEKICAVLHSDGDSYWVLTHFINNFYAFKIDISGVNRDPIKSTVTTIIDTDGYINNAIGYLKVSPDGRKIGIAHLGNASTPGPKGGDVRVNGKVMLYNFNDQTGVVTGGITILSDVKPYGIEFSPKSTKLYATANIFNSDGMPEGSSLYQFNLEKNDIINSKILIDKSNYVAGALQLAIDEKIYRSGYPFFGGTNDFLSVINNPEAEGTSCNYVQNAVPLNTKKVVLGLPPLIQSQLSFTFDYEFTCYGDSTHFYIKSIEKVDNVIWDFGDGFTSNNIEPYHIFTSPGIYPVSLTKIVNGVSEDVVQKDIYIGEAPIIHNEIYDFIQRDISDSNPIDELATFDLNYASDSIKSSNLENYAVYYYSDEQSAHNDLYNQNHFGSSYRNQIPNEIITAKVVDLNSGCYSLGKVKLVATPNIEMFPKYFTPNNDGINDTWKVTGIDEDNYEVSYILIFSRFGKQLAKISSDSEGWDGLYDGKKLPSSDYWFSAELVDPNGSVKIKKGHFSLIRR